MNDTFEAVLRRHLTYLPAGAAIDPDASLKELGLDSMRAVDLVFDIEDELGLALPDDAMNATTFATARNLAEALSTTGTAQLVA